jgi:hypothetical protein
MQKAPDLRPLLDAEMGKLEKAYSLHIHSKVEKTTLKLR